REHGCAIERPARPSGRISALALLKAHGCLLLYFPVFFKNQEPRPPRPNPRPPTEKPAPPSAPASGRIFGDTPFSENFRYPSQVKNLVRIKSLSSHETSAVARERQI